MERDAAFAPGPAGLLSADAAAAVASPVRPPAPRWGPDPAPADLPSVDLPSVGLPSVGLPSVGRGAPELRLDELPLLVLVGPAVAARPPTLELDRPGGLELQAVVHRVGGVAGRPAAVAGMRLSLSDAGLDRAAGLVALGADHGNGCLGAGGLSLGDATRYAARLERLGLRAESSWQGVVEGYYVLDADSWNLRRLVEEPAGRAAERYLAALPRAGASATDVSLVLLGPTCTTTLV